MPNTNSVVIPSARQSNRQNVSTETVEWQFYSSDKTCGRVYRQSRTTKGKPATDVLLPDKLNTFFACFEDNTVPPTKDCGLSFSVGVFCPPEGGAVCSMHHQGQTTCPPGHLQHPMSQEGQKYHQGQQPLVRHYCTVGARNTRVSLHPQ